MFKLLLFCLTIALAMSYEVNDILRYFSHDIGLTYTGSKGQIKFIKADNFEITMKHQWSTWDLWGKISYETNGAISQKGQISFSVGIYLTLGLHTLGF
jgi:hypothetical protein